MAAWSYLSILHVLCFSPWPRDLLKYFPCHRASRRRKADRLIMTFHVRDDREEVFESPKRSLQLVLVRNLG